MLIDIDQISRYIFWYSHYQGYTLEYILKNTIKIICKYTNDSIDIEYKIEDTILPFWTLKF